MNAARTIALSGRQPWWWAILHGGKRIENRTWNTHYRGPILLHAAKGCTVHEYDDAVLWMLDAEVIGSRHDVPPLASMQRGGIVGRARIVDVVPPSGCLSNGQLYPRTGLDLEWHMPDQYGFVLADVEPLPFVSCKGALGLFGLNADGTKPEAEVAR